MYIFNTDGYTFIVPEQTRKPPALSAGVSGGSVWIECCVRSTRAVSACRNMMRAKLCISLADTIFSIIRFKFDLANVATMSQHVEIYFALAGILNSDGKLQARATSGAANSIHQRPQRRRALAVHIDARRGHAARAAGSLARCALAALSTTD